MYSFNLKPPENVQIVSSSHYSKAFGMYSDGIRSFFV